jgi:hypothetical protein
MAVFLYFERAEADRAKLDGLIRSYFGSERTAIVSSELLSALPAEGWSHIVDACHKADAAPSVIYYVRNVHPFYLSSYNQAVRHHGTTESFEEFVRQNSVFDCRERLDLLAELVGHDRLSVAHYESRRGDICRHLVSLLGPAADASRLTFDRACVNRSLDESELRLMRIANRFPQAHFPGELSNFLISSEPDRHAKALARSDIVALLSRRHADDVSAINARYFGGRPALQIADALVESAADTMATAPADTPMATAPAEKLFEWAMGRLSSARHENFEAFLSEARALAARSCKVVRPDLPPDFDAAAYLLANPDVLLARVNPYRHFLDHGRNEGRTWRMDGSGPPERRQPRVGWGHRAIKWVLRSLKLSKP